MDPASISIIWLLLALLLINALLVAWNKSEERFWHPAIFLWLAFLFLNIIFSVSYSRPVNDPLPVYRRGGTPDAAVLQDWATTREKEKIVQRKIFRLLAAQSFISLFLLVLGYQQWGTTMYRQATLSFLAISMVMLALEILFLMGIL